MERFGNKYKGITLAITGSVFWGASGVSAEYLMQRVGISTSWLVSTRMLLAGIIILSYLLIKKKETAFK